jgi:death-on-curing protein
MHDFSDKISDGGASGILNLGPLECALDHIQNDAYYPKFEDKITHLFWVANKNHCFQDGNKRIAITVGSMFLLQNGYLLAAKAFLYKMEAVSYHVAAGNIGKELLRDIISSILYDEDFSEELKLKLMDAFTNNEIDFV